MFQPLSPLSGTRVLSGEFSTMTTSTISESRQNQATGWLESPPPSTSLGPMHQWLTSAWPNTESAAQ
jgi:hypothetical protein